MALVDRSSFVTTSTEDALPVLQPLYPQLTLSPSPRSGFRFEFESADIGLLSTMTYRLASPNSESVADGEGVLSIAHLIGGRMHLTDGRTEVDMRRPFLAPARSFGATWNDVTIGNIALNVPEVERFARLLSGSDSFRLSFTGVNPVTEQLSRFWSATIAMMNRTVLRDDDALTSPLVRRAAFEQVALAVLDVFPNSLMDLRDARDPAQAVPAAVRRAVAFIEEHLDHDITVADIAAAARLSARGLTAAFRRNLDTTPIAHLRAGRLSAAHADLMIGDPTSGVTVAAVAHRWGFKNLSRFAADYRDQFGTTPATTLRG